MTLIGRVAPGTVEQFVYDEVSVWVVGQVGEADNSIEIVVCTVQVARAIWDLRPTGLAHCARFLCVPLDHHEALSDAHACAQIVIAAEIDGWRGPRAKAWRNFGPS